MKRIAVILVLILSALLLLSCGNKSIPDNEPFDTLKTENQVRYLPKEEVRVISYNLDGNTPTIEKRAELLIPHILSYEPDSIGVQEVIYTWGSVLKSMIGKKYGRVGVTDEGPVEKPSASAVYIYYNKEKFDVVCSGTLWLTQTPYNPEGRTCTWAVFENKDTGFRYAHVNTHLEWVDDVENMYQMCLVRDLCYQLYECGYPVFATGDFNTSEGSESYHIMTSTDFMADPKFLAIDTMDIGTMHGGNPNPTHKKPIDFCFVSKDMMTAEKYEVINSVVDYETFMSDHNGIFVHATVNSLPAQSDIVPVISTEGISIVSVDARPYVLDIVFTPANDQAMIEKYRVAAVDENGVEVIVREIPSKHASPIPPDELACTLTGLLPECEYTITIAPMTIVGTYGEAFTATYKTPELK